MEVKEYLSYGDGLSSLDPDQRKAVCHVNGPCLILAGPGSGKTLVLVRRLAYLISHFKIPPSSILTLTFTRAAAAELKERSQRLLGDRAHEMTFGTFHSVFFQILKHTYHFSNDNITDYRKSAAILTETAESLKIELPDRAGAVNGILNEISALKSGGKGENFESAFLEKGEFLRLYDGYKKRMKDLRLIDFDDILLLTLSLFRERSAVLKRWQDRFKFIQADEFQDVDRIQYELLRLLSGEDRNLLAVGDDDQSIYGFRGSDPKLILNFEKDYPGAEKIRLSVNYRSVPEIVKAAGTVISENRIRDKKVIVSGRKSVGTEPDIRGFLNREEEFSSFRDFCQKGMDLNDTAILLRTNELASFYTERLSAFNIPFRCRERVPDIYEHFISRDILSYLAFSAGEEKRSLFYRIMNRPERGISRNALKDERADLNDVIYYHSKDLKTRANITRLKNDLSIISRMRPYSAIHYILKGMGYERYLKELSVRRHLNFEELQRTVQELLMRSEGYRTYEAWKEDMEEYSLKLRELNESRGGKKEGVSVMTLHAGKGLEFKEVFIFDVNETIIPYHKAKLEEEIEEERRLFYVGMTRAKETLHIWHIREYMGKSLKPSGFIMPFFDQGGEPSP